MHYYRKRKTGSYELRPRPSLAERFWARVDKGDGCWEWTGWRNERGYGEFYTKDKRWPAHRYSLVLEGMDLGDFVVDHMCYNPACVRPDHLQLVTNQANCENRKGPNPNNSTGVRGVFSQGRNKPRYFVSVMVNRVAHYGGTFDTVAEAEVAAVALRNELMSNNLLDRRPA